MTIPRRGDRIALDHTDDPHTNLVPGDTGTVTAVGIDGVIDVDWDTGSRLSLIPDTGDRYTILGTDTAPPRYPLVMVRIPPGAVDHERLIGTVRHQLRVQVSSQAAAEFLRCALACRTSGEVLALSQRTVTVLTAGRRTRQPASR